MLHKHLALLLAVLCVSVFFSGSASSQTTTERTKSGLCYDVKTALKDRIAQRITQIRSRIAEQRTQGKTIGYLSVPVSTFGGSFFGVNVKVAAQAKERIEERFGARSVWVLNPASPEFALPGEATGGDYDFMWTQVLEGPEGTGDDFDFVNFVGPSDYARFFGLDGRADMEKLDRFYDELVQTEPKLKSVEKSDFRNYYALRAGASFSLGSHDEWDVIIAINRKRRDATGVKNDCKDSGAETAKIFCTGRQLAVLFDGRAVAPGLFEAQVQPGYGKTCPDQSGPK